VYRWAENGSETVPKSSPVPGREAAPASKTHLRALGASGAALETVPKPPRRTFSAVEKLRIVKEAQACLASGERGALESMMRKEGIYSSLLSSWRVQLGENGKSGLEPRKPGRKPKFDAKDRRIAELQKRNAVLERKLHVADAVIALQKKAHEILGIALPAIDNEN